MILNCVKDRKWMLMPLFLSICMLPLLIYSGMMISPFNYKCDVRNCYSKLVENSDGLRCLIKVLETNQTFIQVCGNGECEDVCCERTVCYVNDNRVSFRNCPAKRDLIWIFILTFFAELICCALIAFTSGFGKDDGINEMSRELYFLIV
jgi:hypothetical protein